MRCVVSVVLQLVVESGHRRGFHALTHMKQWGVLASPRKTIKARMYVAPRPSTNNECDQIVVRHVQEQASHTYNELAKTILKVLSVDKKNVPLYLSSLVLRAQLKRYLSNLKSVLSEIQVGTSIQVVSR